MWVWLDGGEGVVETSVIGSALATIVGLAWGFRMESPVGMACYGVALMVALLAWLRAREEMPVTAVPT